MASKIQFDKEKIFEFFQKISLNNPLIYLILVLSLLFTFWGFNWGVNYHPDELQNRVWRLMQTQDLNPSTAIESHPDYSWAYPTFHIYVLIIINSCYYLSSQIIPFTIFIDFYKGFLFSLDNSVRLSRFITLIMAVLAVFIVFRVGYDAGNENNKRKLSLLGAFVLATSNIWVNNSHFATVDIPMAFWLIVAIFFLYKARMNENYFFIAAFVGGLSFSTKWTGGLFLIVLFLDVLLFIARKDLEIKKKGILIFGSIFMFFVGFFFGCPFFLIDFPNAYDGLIFELSKSRHIQQQPFQAIDELLLILIRGIGIFPTIIGFITLFIWTFLRFYVIIIKRKNLQIKSLINANFENFDTIGLVTWIFFIFQLRKPLIRDTIPIIPFFSIFIAYGTLNTIYFLNKSVKKLKTNKYKQVVPFTSIIMLCVCVFIIPFTSSVYNSFSIQNDTRIQAEHWINKNIQHNSTIAIGSLHYIRYFPQINTNNYYLIEIEPNLDWLSNVTLDYIIISSSHYTRYWGTNKFDFWHSLLNDKIEGYSTVITFEKYILDYQDLMPPMEFISPKITMIKRI